MDEKKSIANDQDQLQVLQVALEVKCAQVKSVEEAYQEVKKKHNAMQAALSNLEELLQSLLTGLSSLNTNNSGGGYLGQQADAKTRLAQGAEPHKTHDEQNGAQSN